MKGLVALLWAMGSAAMAGPITVKDAVIRPAPVGLPTTAAYMTLVNDGARPVRLVEATCGCAVAVMAHRSENRGGVMHMAPAGAVVVPAHGSVSFVPGGLHLMATGLKRPILSGEIVPIRLGFEGAPALTVRFVARR